MERIFLQLEKYNQRLQAYLKKLEEMKILLEESLEMEDELSRDLKYYNQHFNPNFYARITLNG